MTTSPLSAFLVHRRNDLLKKIDSCHVELRDYEKELADIETAGAALHISFPEHVLVIESGQFSVTGQSATLEKGIPDKTMKQSALEILRECTGGLTTNEILEIMNEQLKTSYARSSLSPQLSRLKGDGKIHRKDGRWMLSITEPAEKNGALIERPRSS